MSAPESPTRWDARNPRPDRHPYQPAGAGVERADADGHRRGTRRCRAARDLPAVGKRLLRRDGHLAADDRLRPGGLADRPRRLDGRPRHRRVRQDRRRVRRWAALGQPHARPHPGQHHAVLADRQRRLHPSRSYWEAYGPDAPPQAASPCPQQRSRSPSRPSQARSGGRRAAGSKRATRTSPTSTRSTRAATLLPGRSPSSSRPTSARRSGHSADERVTTNPLLWERRSR